MGWIFFLLIALWESSSCCFPRELVSFVCLKELVSFDPQHNMFSSNQETCLMHPSMLSCWGRGGGKPGIGRRFELKLVFLLKCPASGKSSWVKKVQIPHSRAIIVRQKNSRNDKKLLPWADLQHQIPLL